MTDNPFIQRYKTTDSSQLLDIIDNQSEYQPLAVEAAQLELDSRQLSQEQLTDAKDKQELRRQDNANKQHKFRDIENKAKSVGSLLLDIFSPIQKKTPTTDKTIKLISLYIGGLFLYLLYTDFGTLKYMLTYDLGKWDSSTVLYFFQLIILPTAGLLFWFKKKIGWTLTTIFFSYATVGSILLFIMELNRKPTGVPVLDTPTSPTVYIGTMLLFGGLTWALCNENMREAYHVNKKSMLIALGIGPAIILLPISFGL